MASDLVVYRWTCPICSEQKTCLSTADKPTIVGQAENALLSHVRTRNGSSHGPEGAIPSDLDRDGVIEHVEVDDDVDTEVVASSNETQPYV